MGASQSSGETNINHRTSSTSTYGALRDQLRLQYDNNDDDRNKNHDDQQEDISDDENDEGQHQHISLLEKARMHRQYQQQQQDQQQVNNNNKSKRKQPHSTNLSSGLKTFVDAVHPSEFIAPSTTHTKSDKKGKDKKHDKKDKKKKKSTDETDEDDDLLLFSSSAVKRNKNAKNQSTSAAAAASPPHQGDTLTAEIYHLRSPNPSFVINNNNNSNNNNNVVVSASSSINPKNPSNQNPAGEDENTVTTTNHNNMINQEQQQAPSIYNQKHCYEPPRFAPPFLVDHTEAERYHVNTEFFDVLHTFGLTNSFSGGGSKKRQQQQNLLLVSSQQQALKKSPFRFFGEKGGCNHLLEQAVKRCGIKISSMTTNVVHGDTDNNDNDNHNDENRNNNNHETQQYPHSTSMFSPSIFATTGHQHQQQEQQHLGNQKPKDYQGAFLREFSSSTSSSSSSSSFSHRLFHNASHQGVSSSSLSSCQKCPLCGMCSRHAEICTSTCQPHHYFIVNNNSSSSSSSYKSTCFLEATPKFVSNVIHHQLPFSSSPASPSVSLADLHQQLLKLVLEQYHLRQNNNTDNDNNVFSSFFFPSHHHNDQYSCDDDGKNRSSATMIGTIERAHLVVAELLEASGISSILLSYLSCLEWMMASTSSSSSSEVFNNFVSTSNVHFRLRKGSVIEFDRVSVELEGNSNSEEDSSSSSILVSVKEVLFPSSLCSSSSVSDHWSTTLKRFVVVSANKNQNVTDITSRNFYRKMRSEFASSIVFSLLQMMLLNKSKMIC